jgi:predicted nucleotidyltransferase
MVSARVQAQTSGCTLPNLGINMPDMGKLDDVPVSLADALFTRTQQRVLRLLFGQPGRSFFASELIAMTGSGSGAVQRELKRLTASGLVTVRQVGRQKHYQANAAAPIFEELRNMVRKTVAVVEPLRDILEPLAERIELALVYGSVAKGEDTASSDIDLLVVADDLTLEALYTALAQVESDLARKVNPTLYTPAEFARRREVGNAFVERVMRGEHLLLIGTLNEPSPA